MVDPRRVEGVEPELGALAVPPIEHRLRDRAVREPLEAGPARGAQAREGFVGGCADRDVVGMAEDPVGAERDDNGGILLVEDPSDRRDDVVEGSFRDPTVGQTEPLVTIRNAAECSPCGFVLAPSHRSERLARRRESLTDVPCSPNVAWIRTNLKSGSSACRATLPATPYASSSGCAKTHARVRLRDTTQRYPPRAALPSVPDDSTGVSRRRSRLTRRCAGSARSTRSATSSRRRRRQRAAGRRGWSPPGARSE